MKQIISKLVILFFAVVASHLTGLAQANQNSFANNPDFFANAVLMFANEKDFSETHRNDINIKAVRNFIRLFENVTNKKWYTVSDGYFASFTKDEVETKVAFDAKGNWHCTLTTYNENQMPHDIRDMVKSRYYDFNIMVAYEIRHERGIVYIIKISDATKIKTLRIIDDEIEVTGNYTRG